MVTDTLPETAKNQGSVVSFSIFVFGAPLAKYELSPRSLQVALSSPCAIFRASFVQWILTSLLGNPEDHAQDPDQNLAPGLGPSPIAEGEIEAEIEGNLGQEVDPETKRDRPVLQGHQERVRLIVKAPTILVILKTRRKGEETAETIPRKEAFHLKEKEENVAAPLIERERRITALKSRQ
eukprot:TRINITY_DN783_c0_g1_i1.p1 TRINITY_DN783_c0_g1~~TRINITY_DN783_c0_g1_i1.p1  ORF type:complete len:180 (-),score=22.95 TRINITY_DN783_c0_g1_i1:127-666(-)